ncbi:Ubiquitin-like modifier-activating enzyme 5 [Aphelenchoides bicaudatus]|nr:Ubiquitin-like modifier-activating enzyme 5 [Aphelenchoides bicaudatus]
MFGSTTDTKIDLLVDCSNNFDIQMSTNIACNEQSQPWISCSGISPLRVHVRFFDPGRTACFLCNQYASQHHQRTQRDNSFQVESVLPSTASILSGLATQMALAFLLKFGQIQDCIDYDSFYGILESSNFSPNPHCTEATCCQRQKEGARFDSFGQHRHTQTIQIDASQQPVSDMIDLTESQPKIETDNMQKPARKRPSIFIQLNSQGEEDVKEEQLDKFEEETKKRKNFVETNNKLTSPLRVSTDPDNKFESKLFASIKISPRTFNLVDDLPSNYQLEEKPSISSASRPKTKLKLDANPIKFRHDFKFAIHLRDLNTPEEIKKVKNLRFNMTGKVKEIKGQNVVYKSCLSKSCKQSVTEIDDRYWCPRCGVCANYKTAYRVDIVIEDLTDRAEIVLLDAGAEKLFGVSATELAKLLNEENDEYQRIIRRPLQKCHDFEVRYDVKTVNGTLTLTLISDLCGQYDAKRYENNIQNTGTQIID